MSTDIAGLNSEEKRQLLRDLLEQRRSFPLSEGQRQLFSLQQLAPESAAYLFPVALRIRSRHSAELLRKALQQLFERHDIFRVTFALDAGEVVQRVGDKGAVPFEVVDAHGLDENALSVAVSAAAARPIDLEHGPVFRACLFQRNETDAVLLLVWHHIVLDGWSLGVVLEELDRVCRALATQQSISLPPAPSYREFVEWQQQFLASERGQRGLEFWQRQTSKIERLDLPADFPRPPHRRYRGGSVVFTLGAATAHRVNETARADGTTPFVVLLSAFQALLFRVTNNSRIPIAFPTSGRPADRFSNVAGYFVNQVAIASELDEDTTFRQLIAANKGRVLEALEHQEVPLPSFDAGEEKLVARGAVADVMFILQRARGYELESGPHLEASELTAGRSIARTGRLGPMTVESFPLLGNSARFDLELQMMEQGGAFAGWLQYDADLFEHRTAEALTLAFQQIVQQLVDGVDQPVSRVSLLDRRARQHLALWNSTARTWPDEGSISALFDEAADAHADDIAVTCGHASVTFAELRARVNRTARWLDASGVEPGEVIGVAIPRSVDAIVAILAAVRVGAAYLPLDPSSPRARLEYILEDSGVRRVVTSEGSCAGLGAQRAQFLCMHCERDTIVTLSPDPVQPRRDEQLYVIYTSGSSGAPKGVIGTQAGTINRLRWMWETFPFTTRERCAQTTTFNFVDHVWEIFGPLLKGVTVDIIADQEVRDAAELIGALERWRCTRITVVPALLRELLDHDRISRISESLRICTCSGEVLPTALARRFHELFPSSRLLNLYGCSEASADSCCFEVLPGFDARRVPIGKPIANTRVYLLDRFGNEVPPGLSGEVFIAGAGVASGYLNRPELTAERFRNDARHGGDCMYRTGDMARFQADGNLEFLGRSDLQLKVRGSRIEPGEVEAVLQSHADVAESVVSGHREKSGDVALVAYLVARHPASDDEQAFRLSVRRHLAQQLPSHLIPSHIVLLPSLPRTATGKLDRRALPAPDIQHANGRYVAPRTPLEIAVATIWSDVLAVSPVSVDADFFELGGHSILALQVAARTSRYIGTTIPVALVFEYPTIASFAARIEPKATTNTADTRPGERRHRVVPVQAHGTRPPLFWVPGGAGTLQFSGMKTLAATLGEDQPMFGLGTSWSVMSIAEVESVVERARDFVEVLRDAQPAGPYYLAGFCLGGVVAFEMAQQLRAAGDDVAFLAMVNCWMPAQSIRRSRWMGLYLQRAAYHVRRAMHQDAPHRYVLQRLRTARRVFAGEIVAEGERLLERRSDPDAPPIADPEVLVRAASHLASSYQPRRYHGPIHIYLTDEPGLEGVSNRLDPRQAWRRVADVNITWLTGDHVPDADSLGEAMRRHLDALHAPRR